MEIDQPTQESGIPGDAYLVLNSQVIPLSRLVTSIGRKLNNDLVIQEVLISRRHAEIRYENKQFVIYDLGSTGGTYLNNKKIQRGTLYSGDIINISNIPIMFIHDDGLEEKAEKRTGGLRG